MDFILNKENKRDEKTINDDTSSIESASKSEVDLQKNSLLKNITNLPTQIYLEEFAVNNESNIHYKKESEVKLSKDYTDDLYVGQKNEVKMDLKHESNMNSYFCKENSKNLADMYHIAQTMGISVSERLKKLSEVKEKSGTCATFKNFKPSVELLTMDYESECDKVFTNAESPHMLLTYSVLYSGKYS